MWKRYKSLIGTLTLIVFLALLLSNYIWAQTDVTGNRPIDMMIVIDNSHSMYGAGGNDPEQLRVIGSDIFIARLGVGEPNEGEYRAGVVSMGGEPTLVAHLQPLESMRGTLARAIADPADAGGTHIIHALEMAYQELRDEADPTHMPAIVLLTDGVPDPPEGQSQSDIEKLVSENPDIPLFVMLLQNGERGTSSEYREYMEFWQRLQTKYTHLFTYPVKGAGQIEGAYNEIVAQLQSTVPSEGYPVSPGVPLRVFVSRYVNKLEVTVIHNKGERGNIVIKDPTGAVVTEDDTDVSHFDDPDNPVEVYSIGKKRIGDLVDDVWTIETDEKVIVHLDRLGAYRINFESPKVSLTDVGDVYLAMERYSPSEPLVLRISLTDSEGHPVLDQQPIYGKVIHPDGSEAELRIPADIQPDSAGIYEIQYDYSTYPKAMTDPGRYTFVIEAGEADPGKEGERIPIARARLYVDVGRSVYISSIEPDSITCASGQEVPMTIHLGDIDTANMDTAHVRVFAGGKDLELTRNADNSFSGDVSSLCTSLISSLSCSTAETVKFRVRLVAQAPDNTILPPSEREVDVIVQAPSCTPTPMPTPTPLPPPTPTPIPDSDGDGWNDVTDQCINTPGVDQFQGCPIPWWAWLIGVVLAAALLAFMILFLIPWSVVHISPPPKGYIQVIRKGKREGSPKSVYSAGMSKRTRKVTIGGDKKKDTIVVKDLKPGEFFVDKQGDKVVLMSSKGTRKGSFGDRGATQVNTSNPEVSLRISLDQTKL